LDQLVRWHPSLLENEFSAKTARRGHRGEINGTDLIQILLNLTVNAFNARSSATAFEAGGETLRAPLDLAKFKDGPNDRLLNVESLDNTAPLVRLWVRDTGPGIPPEVLPKIFQPYFTTKGPRRERAWDEHRPAAHQECRARCTSTRNPAKARHSRFTCPARNWRSDGRNRIDAAHFAFRIAVKYESVRAVGKESARDFSSHFALPLRTSLTPSWSRSAPASFGKRSIKTSAKLAGLKLAVSMCDLTTLEGKDTPGKVAYLCRKALQPIEAKYDVPSCAPCALSEHGEIRVQVFSATFRP